MINAIINNKVDRQYFKTNEDSLTSFVFEKLSYLPNELFEYLIRHSVNDEIPEFDFKSFREITYWPHWDSDRTTNKKFVEPDIFIRFEKYDLLIEAKRYDENQQYSSQWKNEIIAYQNEYKGDNKKLIFIALGGINNFQTEFIQIDNFEQKIYKCKWSSILNNIRMLKKQIEPSSNLLNTSFTVNNIFNDLILIFQLYGYSIADWFETFEYEKGITDFGINKLLEKKVLYE